jgi:MFS family permease
MITSNHVALKDAHKTLQFWLIWAVLCLNVSAGIGLIGAASPMLQETFGGALFHDPSVGFNQFSDEQKTLAAAIGGGFVGLFSLFNIGGRFFWATLSDTIGRKTTYFVFFLLGMLCYGAASTLAGMKAVAVFAAAFCIIASMYGGGFATVPAYLADIFGTRYVGAIHGRWLTAWSTAGIIGPVIVNYLHDTRVVEGVARDQVYDLIFYVLAALLVAGFICNALIRPVHAYGNRGRCSRSPRHGFWAQWSLRNRLGWCRFPGGHGVGSGWDSAWLGRVENSRRRRKNLFLIARQCHPRARSPAG